MPEEPRAATGAQPSADGMPTVRHPLGGPRPEALRLEIGATVGRYVVLGLLGEGGIGRVYAAYDPELDRKIALKILQPEIAAGEPTASLRLLREAQAMARLSPPNVIAVHDVGPLGDLVFVAMEFVEGSTLRDWLGEKPRTWREILAVFQAAGRGLEAAHEAGLVHRDFKPSNVLVGRDGRVRVVDFGLARAVLQGEDRGASKAAPVPERAAGATALDSQLTAAGAIQGTPAYMAPEQYRGEPATPAADQFSFCVALYEALYGRHPFPARHPVERLRVVHSGRVAEPAEGRQVPGWLRPILLRGLRPEAADRHPDMGRLLAEMARDPAAVRRRWLTAALAVVLAAGSAAGWYRLRADRLRLCRDAGASLAEIWDGERRQRLEQAFLASGQPFAATVWRGVAGTLDGYAGAWVEARNAACAATRLRGEQSEDLLDLRMLCYDRRLEELRALSDLLITGDPLVVKEASRAAHSLSDLSYCADAEALLAKVRPPSEPAARAAVEALAARLAKAKALRDAGRYEEALARALWRSGRERSRARGLAEAARDGYREAGARGAKELREVEAWLEHGRGGSQAASWNTDTGGT